MYGVVKRPKEVRRIRLSLPIYCSTRSESKTKRMIPEMLKLLKTYRQGTDENEFVLQGLSRST